jgi:hypothetical protein
MTWLPEVESTQEKALHRVYDIGFVQPASFFQTRPVLRPVLAKKNLATGKKNWKNLGETGWTDLIKSGPSFCQIYPDQFSTGY